MERTTWCCSRRREGSARETTRGGVEGGERMGLEGAEELSGGDGDVAGEGLHAGLLGEHGVGAEGLAEPLDRGGGERGGDVRPLGMALRVMPQEALLEGGGEVGVGVAEQAGEIVGGRAAPHALVIDQNGPLAAEQDVAGLQVAVDQRLRGFRQKKRNGFQFGSNGRDLLFRSLQGAA